MGERIAYVRVSTIEQNEARQVEELKKHDIQKWFIEKVSGKNTDRPELQKMLDYIREGDTVYVHDLSRLSRSTSDLLKLVEFFAKKKVELVSNKENIDSSTPTGKLMLTMIAAINEFERQNLLERQREGIAIAKREGKYKGHSVKKLILIFLIKPMLNIRIEKSVKQKWPDVLKYQDRHCISSLLIRVYLDTPEPIHLERSCKPCLQTVIYEPIISHFSCGKHQQNSCSRRQIPLYAIKCNNLQSARKNSF